MRGFARMLRTRFSSSTGTDFGFSSSGDTSAGLPSCSMTAKQKGTTAGCPSTSAVASLPTRLSATNASSASVIGCATVSGKLLWGSERRDDVVVGTGGPVRRAFCHAVERRQAPEVDRGRLVVQHLSELLIRLSTDRCVRFDRPGVDQRLRGRVIVPREEALVREH